MNLLINAGVVNVSRRAAALLSLAVVCLAGVGCMDTREEWKDQVSALNQPKGKARPPRFAEPVAATFSPASVATPDPLPPPVPATAPVPPVATPDPLPAPGPTPALPLPYGLREVGADPYLDMEPPASPRVTTPVGYPTEDAARGAPADAPGETIDSRRTKVKVVLTRRPPTVPARAIPATPGYHPIPPGQPGMPIARRYSPPGPSRPAPFRGRR